MRYLLGLIGFILGILLVIYRVPVKQFVGDISWGEKWFGPGGTYTLLLIFGIAVSVGSLMFMLGTLQLLVQNILGPLFGAS